MLNMELNVNTSDLVQWILENQNVNQAFHQHGSCVNEYSACPSVPLLSPARERYICEDSAGHSLLIRGPINQSPFSSPDSITDKPLDVQLRWIYY